MSKLIIPRLEFVLFLDKEKEIKYLEDCLGKIEITPSSGGDYCFREGGSEWYLSLWEFVEFYEYGLRAKMHKSINYAIDTSINSLNELNSAVSNLKIIPDFTVPRENTQRVCDDIKNQFIKSCELDFYFEALKTVLTKAQEGILLGKKIGGGDTGETIVAIRVLFNTEKYNCEDYKDYLIVDSNIWGNKERVYSRDLFKNVKVHGGKFKDRSLYELKEEVLKQIGSQIYSWRYTLD